MSDSREEHALIVRIQSDGTEEELAKGAIVMLGDSPEPQNATELKPDRHKDVEQFALEITSAWGKTLESIFAVGKKLIEAKQKLEHGQFEQMVRDQLPFSERTAQRLMAIAADQRLTNPDYMDVLPHSWGTLYELTTLNDDVFEEGIKRKIVGPEMTRKHILELKQQLEREKEKVKEAKRLPSSLNDKLTRLFSKEVFINDPKDDDQWAEDFDKFEKIVSTLDAKERYTILDRVQRSLEQAIERMNERVAKIQELKNDIQKPS